MMRISMAQQDEGSRMNAKDSTSSQAGSGADRKKRLAEELRANLQKRKAQARSRRIGEADSRPEGIAAASKTPETDG
jgi:hypothetical protein